MKILVSLLSSDGSGLFALLSRDYEPIFLEKFPSKSKDTQRQGILILKWKRTHFWLTSRGGGLLPYKGYIGMCRCKGYGFQAVYSRTGYINQSVLV